MLRINHVMTTPLLKSPQYTPDSQICDMQRACVDRQLFHSPMYVIDHHTREATSPCEVYEQAGAECPELVRSSLCPGAGSFDPTTGVCDAELEATEFEDIVEIEMKSLNQH